MNIKEKKFLRDVFGEMVSRLPLPEQAHLLRAVRGALGGLVLSERAALYHAYGVKAVLSSASPVKALPLPRLTTARAAELRGSALNKIRVQCDSHPALHSVR